MKTIIILSALAIILEVTNSYSLRTTIINRKPLCRSLNSVDSKDIGGIEGGLTPQIARLKAMAAKLRAEAADMEAVQKVEDLKGITSVFSKFDLDNDGSISIEELRQGLEEALMVTVTQQQVRKVMAQFDKSGDGALQLEEFPLQGVSSFKIKLDNILRDEKTSAAVAQKDARAAKDESDELEKIVAMINNKPPTISDRIVSTIPYLLPLLDAVPYGKNLIVQLNPTPNPALDVLAVLYTLYEQIPFSGLIAFFAFNALANNLQLNRLIRFNIQQAIFIDIALIFPGILGSAAQIITMQTTGQPIAASTEQLGSSVTFLVIAASIMYSLISTLAGQEPDKLPLISSRVQNRVPTTDEFKSMLKDNIKQIKDIENNKGKPPSKDNKDKDDEGKK